MSVSCFSFWWPLCIKSLCMRWIGKIYVLLLEAEIENNQRWKRVSIRAVEAVVFVVTVVVVVVVVVAAVIVV